MKNILKLSALFCAAVLTVVSCQKDEIDTAQYSDSAVTLASFGPNPAMRGGTVTFYGSNLDKITEVNVPGMSAITGSAIEVVESGKTSQIRVSLDLEAPEIGIVTLKASDGTVLQTKSELTYKEPIVFDGFTAKDVNYPGDVITLSGTYMDLIKVVKFEGGEEVEVNEGSTRHSATVTIPANALTGIIVLSDKAEIESLFYSKEELVMGEPTVKAIEKTTVKVGETITFTGEHLEMIEKIALDGAEVTDFVLSDDKKSISFTLPASAKSGDFNAVSFAGKSYKAGEVDAIVPTVASVAPNPVKAGETLVITGENLDLITKVAFDGNDNATFTYENGSLKINVTSKVKEGKVQLITANESAIEAEFTLVHPVVTKVESEEIFAGDTITVVGKDLDLIVSVKLGKNEESVIYQSADTLLIATAATSASGALVLSLDNEETVTASEEVKVSYHSLVIVTERPDGQHIGQTVTLKGKNMSLVESVYIGSEKVTKYSLRTDEELSFLMPYNKVGSYKIKFVLYDGSEEVQAKDIEVLNEQILNVVFEGEATVSWNNAVTLANSLFEVGQSMVIEYKAVAMPDGYNMLRIINSDWSFNPDGNPTYNKSFSEDGVWEVPITAELFNNLQGKDMSFSGYGCAITKITLITEISQEVVLWTGEAVADNWKDQPYLLSDEGLELQAANAQAGQQVRFYLSPMDPAWKLQIVEGHWSGATYCSYCSVGNDTEGGKFTEIDLDAAGGFISITLTQEMLDTAYTKQWWGGTFIGNGDKVKITKITLL